LLAAAIGPARNINDAASISQRSGCHVER